jgi:hypothetical protein
MTDGDELNGKPILEEAPRGISIVAQDDDLSAVGARLPVGFHALQKEKRFELVSKIRPRSLGFFIPFTLFWDGFMVVWFSIAVAAGEWLMAAAGSVHGLVGVGLTYSLLRQLLNRKHFKVDEDELQVQNKPLRWPGSFTIRRDRLTQLYVTRGEAYRVNGRPVLDYRVMAKIRGEKEKILVSGLKTYEQARFIEQEIERVWQIEDQKVAKEQQPF